jgi:hypothetical protein
VAAALRWSNLWPSELTHGFRRPREGESSHGRWPLSHRGFAPGAGAPLRRGFLAGGGSPLFEIDREFVAPRFDGELFDVAPGAAREIADAAQSLGLRRFQALEVLHRVSFPDTTDCVKRYKYPHAPGWLRVLGRALVRKQRHGDPHGEEGDEDGRDVHSALETGHALRLGANPAVCFVELVGSGVVALFRGGRICGISV